MNLPHRIGPPHTGLIAFDLDGTLIDSLPTVARLLRSQPGYSYSEMSIIDQCQMLYPYSSSGAFEMIKSSFKNCDEAEVLKCFRDNYAKLPLDEEKLIPGAKLVLEHTRSRDLPIALVTNKPEELVSRCLDFHGLKNYFYKIITPNVAPKKPSPLGLIMLSNDCPATSTAIFVGDSLEDAIAANLAGWDFIHFADLRYAKSFFELHHPSGLSAIPRDEKTEYGPSGSIQEYGPLTGKRIFHMCDVIQYLN